MGKIVKDRIIYGGTPYLSAETGDVLSVDENGNVVGVDPDTLDTKVTQTQDDSTDNDFEILLAGSTSTSTATEGTKKTSGLVFNPSQQAITIGSRKANSTIGEGSFASGYNVEASSDSAHAEGSFTEASGVYAHAEGNSTTASGESSHAEGDSTEASGVCAHAEGHRTTASSSCAHAEGDSTTASSGYAHAEGYSTTASSTSAHAEGINTTASGYNAHAEGDHTIANHKSQHVFGEYNIADPSSVTASSRGNYVEIVGNGDSSARSNARTLDWNGNEVLSGKLTVGTAPTNNMDVATKQYADSKVDKSGDTMTGALTVKNGRVSWIKGREGAGIKNVAYDDSGAWYPVSSVKSMDGSWEYGTFSGSNNLYFSYAADSNYSANSNKTNRFMLTPIDTNDHLYTIAHSGNVATGDSNGQVKIAGTNVSVKGLGTNAYSSTSYLPTGGGTMTGQILTSFKNSVAMGSYQAEATTIPNLLTELRYSSGCCGSFSLGTAYSANSVTIAKGWYNFFYSPHRSGGINGSASQDNCSYGTLLLGGMTVDGFYKIRFSGGSIAHVSKIPDYISDVPMHSIWNSGVGIGLATNPNDSYSIGIGVSNATTFRSNIGAQATLSTSAAALTVTYDSTNATTNNDMWYAKYGNVVQICGSVKNKNAITIPSHGDMGDLLMFTLPTGYRPKVTAAGVADNGNLVAWKITSDGAVRLTAVYRSTGTYAAGTVFYIRAIFIV